MSFLLDEHVIDSFRLGGPAYVPTYLNYAMLIHFDGTNGSTVITDEMGHSATAYGNAKISTSDPKFGTGSLLLDGSGDYVLVADSADFVLGSDDFTIDFWIKLPSDFTSANRFCIFSHYTNTSSNYMLAEVLGNRLSFAAKSGGSDIMNFSTYTLSWTTGIWYHIAFVRSGSTLKIYRDGVSQAIDTSYWYKAFTGGTFPDYTSDWKIGVWSASSRYFKGNIDEFRLVHRALWTADFTPPARAA